MIFFTGTLQETLAVVPLAKASLSKVEFDELGNIMCFIQYSTTGIQVV